MNRLKNKNIYLIRHAQSKANAGEKTFSPKDNHLTEEGMNQAKELVTKFPNKIDFICYSSFVRTYETALPLINLNQGAIIQEWDCIHEFTYLNHDHCANTTVQDRLPLVKQYWERLDPNYSDGKNAESFSEFLARIKITLKKLSALPYENICVFSHGQFIEGLILLLNNPNKSNKKLMELFLSQGKGKNIANCQVVKLDTTFLTDFA